MVLTPVMWQNYLLMLAVPLALAPEVLGRLVATDCTLARPACGAVHGIETVMPAFTVVLLVFLIVTPLGPGKLWEALDQPHARWRFGLDAARATRPSGILGSAVQAICA